MIIQYTAPTTTTTTTGQDQNSVQTSSWIGVSCSVVTTYLPVQSSTVV